MAFTTGIVTAMMVFSIYFLMFDAPAGTGQAQHGAVAAAIALVAGAVAYAVVRPRRRRGSSR
ncbi:hypothetical protein FGG90_13090 [Clavibacter tessellarius]|uniref:Uncharacterized protein n=1 Tax=Clavibacter tessellarius TaxID=31965 RepID=A0A225C5C1_9MICO|nr:hypothetical protein [Clavibacter michiganensis]MBT1635157.1 hypothetical protein [Clavibacter michiganensis]OQJ62167.1 hypothetical protein B5P24_03615 [Clavibacter michiganensis subsp. tessellarius]UKF34831.1 hypothetical protein FGG90_13090 [Clavibacter michiganensis subsp. tessellarius]